MRFILLLAFLASPVTAQEEVVIPAVGRPESDFYDAAGKGITVRFEGESTEVVALEWFTLTLIVERIENPERMTVPDLRQRAEFRESFDFRETPPVKRIQGQKCEIVYSLRARDESVTRVPSLPFRYYFVGRETGRPELDFPTTLAPSLPLTVRAAERPLSPIQPLEPVAFELSLPDSIDMLLPSSHPKDEVNWLWLLPPVLGVAWIFVWQRLYPDAAKLARFRRGRAARKALLRLNRETDPAAMVEVFLDYLRQRFDLEPWRVTPREVSDGLPGNLDSRLRDAIEMDLKDIDRLRFAPEPARDFSSAQLQRRILELEESWQ